MSGETRLEIDRRLLTPDILMKDEDEKNLEEKFEERLNN
jgi:hypothetical protein